MENLINIPDRNRYIESEFYVKIYPRFIKIFKYHEPKQFLQKGFEEQKQSIHLKAKSQNHVDLRSIRRTRTTISDLVLCNDFEIFATFTFKDNRDNIEKCKQRMSNWLKSQQKKYGAFQYLIVPEFHKDGKSLHFHALLKDYKGKLEKTTIRQNNRTIYNISSYQTGFTTAVYIQNLDKVSSYIRKYITKEMPKFNGKKRYWCSNNLNRPVTSYSSDYFCNPFLDKVQVYENEYLTMYEIQVQSMGSLSRAKRIKTAADESQEAKRMMSAALEFVS